MSRRPPRRETMRVGVTGFGSNDDLTVNFLAKKGLKFVSVPFPKPGERYSAILGGHAEVLYEQIGDVRNFVDNKQMKPVIIFAEKRDPNFPDVPTSVELGHKVTLPQFRAIVVKAGTDPKIVKKLADALAEAAKDPEYAAYLKEQYADRQQLRARDQDQGLLDNELKAMKQLIASSGVTKETSAPAPSREVAAQAWVPAQPRHAVSGSRPRARPAAAFIAGGDDAGFRQVGAVRRSVLRRAVTCSR